MNGTRQLDGNPDADRCHAFSLIQEDKKSNTKAETVCAPLCPCAWLSSRAPCTCRCLRRTEEGVRSPGAIVSLGVCAENQLRSSAAAVRAEIDVQTYHGIATPSKNSRLTQ